MAPKLTPEEKKELKARKKAEKKAQQIEKKKQLKRDVLARELKYSSLTVSRHEKEWRGLLIKIALPHMRDELEFAWHNFERVIDCKDFTISLLMDEIRDAEEQYMMNAKNHVEHIDQLIDMFHERLEELESDNDMAIAKLRSYYEDDVEQVRESATEDENYLKTMIYILEMKKKEQKQTVRAEYFSKLEEDETKYTQIIQKLKGVLEKVHYTLYMETREFLDNYNNQVKERKRQHDTLKARDEELQKLLFNQLEKIRKTYDSIRVLRRKWADSQKFLGRKLKDLETELNFFKLAFNTLKKKLIIDRKKDTHVLNILTTNFNETAQTLQKLQERGEHILHVAAVCRKLETLEEKILPFPLPSAKDVVDNTVIRELKPEYVACLEIFWQRVAQADASRYAINEEREFLKTENQILKMKLHKYCQCLTCPIPEKNVMQQIKHVTEGAIELQKYQKQACKDSLSSMMSSILDNTSNNNNM